MKFTALSDNLLPVVTDAVRVINPRTSLPVLSNILLRTVDAGVEVTSTNLELGFRQVVPGKIDSDGAITLPGKTLLQLLKSAPKNTRIDFELDGETASIKAGPITRRIRGIDAEEFPVVIVDEPHPRRLELDRATFAEALARTIWAAADDAARPILTGVSIQSVPGGLELAGCDNFKVAVASITVAADDVDLVIPAKNLAEVLRGLEKGIGGLVGMSWGARNDVLFEMPNDALYVSRRIDGQFPNYQQVLPPDNDSLQLVARFDRNNALSLVKAAGNPDAGVLKLFLTPDQLTIKATSDGDEFDASIDLIDGNNGQNHVALRVDNLLPVLQNMPAGEVTLRMSSPLAPVTFLPDELDSRVVVMPVKVTF